MAIEDNIEKTDHWFLGEDKTLSFTIYQSDGSTAQNITGWALRFVLRPKPSTADPALLTKETSGSGITITNGSSGLCEVEIADTDTEDLAEAKYFYSLKRTDAGEETILTFGYAYLRRATALA